jgi:hypothetical protein
LALVLGVDADHFRGGGVEALEGVGHQPAALIEGAGDAAEPARVVRERDAVGRHADHGVV